MHIELNSIIESDQKRCGEVLTILFSAPIGLVLDLRGLLVYGAVPVGYHISGKLYPVGTAWERTHFDFTSWRFFREDEFAALIDQKHFFIAYVLFRDPTPDKPAYQGEIFIIPVRDFDRIIRCGIPSKGQRKIYLSRLKGEAERWVLRRATCFDDITEDTCLDVTAYRRNFDVLLNASDGP